VSAVRAVGAARLLTRTPCALTRLASVLALCICGIALAMLWSGSALAAGDANQASCPAETESSPGFRSYLPDCRAYEMVTPPSKGAAFFQQQLLQLMSTDGTRLIGESRGGLAGTGNNLEAALRPSGVYEFSRTPTGWATEALAPPAAQFSYAEFMGASADLGRTLWYVATQSRPGEELHGAFPTTFMLREGQPGSTRFIPVGPRGPGQAGPQENFFALEAGGESADLTHIVYKPAFSGPGWPGDTTDQGSEHPSIYEYAGTSNQEPVLVGVKNAGPLHGSPHVNEGSELTSECGIELGASEGLDRFNAISADGSVVYFTALHGECATPLANELYARVDGSATVAISGYPSPECTGACAVARSEPKPAQFQGASEDGSKVFFTTSQPLVDGDTDASEDLYMAELAGGEVKRLIQVSRGDATDPTPGSGANVLRVARVSPDGSHIYFAAQGVLTRTPNDQRESAESDAVNLYVYDTVTGTTAFVARLATTGEISREGEVLCGQEGPSTKLECEENRAGEALEIEATHAGLTRFDEHPFDTTSDGRFLAFLSRRDLTGSEDTSTVDQAFEYDAQNSALVRVSVGQRSVAYPSGYDSNGNTTTSDYGARIVRPQYGSEQVPAATGGGQSVAADGTVAFTSRVALTPQATAGSVNVYEYREGNVYLISAGGDQALEQEAFGFTPEASQPAETSGRLLGIDAHGSDLFFSTVDSLVPQDTDTQVDWYDAHIDGGFPAAVAPAQCIGEGCQGALSAVPSLPAPGSASQLAGGDLSAPVAGHTAPVAKHASPSRAQQLAKALRDCRRRSGRRRHTCEAAARKRYRRAAKATRTRGVSK
jgi:hypothetical protein